MASSSLNLARNNYFYNYFLNNKILNVKDELDDGELMERIMFLATFAWRNHPGYFFDGRLENIVFNYGKNLEKYVDEERTAYDMKNIVSQNKEINLLHLATELGAVGGHTRVLYQLIKRNKEKNQIVVLTSQRLKNVPQWFIEGIGNTPVVVLSSINSLFERAFILRQMSRFSNKILLYHHPFDVVPVMAFANDTYPPVLLENHAHSWFWLGASIADMVFSHSSFHRDLTRKIRPVNNAYLLPVTQIDDVDLTFNKNDKASAKEKLHINPNTICIITVGTSDKFIPNVQYDFFKTAHKIIDRFDNVEIFIIGINNGANYHIATDKIHFLGPVSDPSDYYKAADICLDALPQPSLGATYYAALIGMACPLHKYGDSNIFNCKRLSESKLYEQYIGTPRNEIEYLDKLEFLINSPDIRIQIANEIRDEYSNAYSKESLGKYIEHMLKAAENLDHKPGTIPDGVYHQDADSAEIADAGFLQDLPSTLEYFNSYLSRLDKLIILMQLSIKRACTRDVLRLALNWIKNKSFGFYFRRARRFSWPV